MTTTIAANRTNAKLWFAGLYLITIAIMLIIFMALWQDTPIQPVVKNAEVVPVVKEDGTMVQAASLLHNRMQSLQEAYLIAISSKNNQQAITAENAFIATTDSLERTNELVKHAQQKTALKKMTLDFKTSFEKIGAIIKRYDALPKDTVYSAAGNDEAMQNLKGMLVEKEQKIADLQNQMQQQLLAKDETIASLQAQVKNSLVGKDKNVASLQTQMQTTLAEKDKKFAGLQLQMQTSVAEKDKRITILQNSLQTSVAEKDRTITGLQNQVKTLYARQTTTTTPQNTSNDNGAEWRQKYAQIKSSYDNLASKNNALLNSYKTLAQDNKRLTSQLQIRRATARG